MPSKPKESPSAADAAVAEVAEPKILTVPFGGEEYTCKAKRLNSIQFRLLWQKGQDIAAVEWLLGPVQFAQFLRANTDADGCTSSDVWNDFMIAVGGAVGAGNS